MLEPQSTDRDVNFLAVFNMHLEKTIVENFRHQVFPTALIGTTITRCPANFINLSAIVVDLRLAEYGIKLRRDLQIAKIGVTPDVFKIPPKGILRILVQNFRHRVLIY